MPSHLEISAASEQDFPRSGLPEIALVGRSNVGKSSLINALVRQKIARTSAAPGKTRLANFYRTGEFYLVDLPGYGYARGLRQAQAAPSERRESRAGLATSADSFEALTQQYFDRSATPMRRLAGVFHLIDARHPALRQDAQAHEWLLSHGLPIAVVATKMDKLSKREQLHVMKALAGNYGARVLPVSALKGTGLTELWQLLREWARSATVSG